MAKLTSTLTLSAPLLTSDALNFTISAEFEDISDTSGIARKKITSTAIGTASGQVTLDTAGEFAAPSVIYIHNPSDYHLSQNVVKCYFSGDPDGVSIQIHGGQFAYIPLSSSFDLKAFASHTDTYVEFCVFGNLA